MWTATISRDELIAIVQREEPKDQPLRPIESLMDLTRDPRGLVAVWEEKPDHRSLPNLLLMPDIEKRDFFAWASSYVKIKPLTAFIRTLDFETLNSISAPAPNNDRWQRGLIGLILAEALTYLDQPPTTKLSLRTCEATYSFATARSLLRVQGPPGVRQTGLNWFRSREALGNRASKLALPHLQGIWSVITQLVGSDSADPTVSQAIVQSCRNLFQFGDISDADWQTLTKDMPVYDLRVVMQNTREERVIVLENFLKSLGSRTAKEEVAFLVGYLVSLVAPGTLDHWRLLNPIRQSLPTAGMWYGFCAGLRPESPIDSYGAGVGRLVMRELQRKVDLFEQPTCDIAVDELDITGPFFKSEGASGSNTVEVEISPGISVPFRSNGIDQLRPEVRLDPTSARFNEPSLDPRVLESLDDALYALEEVRRVIQKSIPNSARSDFNKSRKKRPSR